MHLIYNIYLYVITYMGFPGGSAGKESACNAGGHGSIPGPGRSPERYGYHSTIFVWRIPWTRSLAGYSPWGCKELGTNE